MSEENEVTSGTAEKPSELDLLKERAEVMGISFHPNIGIEKLKAKIEERQSPPEIAEPQPYAEEEAATITQAAAANDLDVFTPGVKETAQQIQNKLKKDALRLVRVRVTCMNPIKSNMPGDIFNVGNAVTGGIRKYVPFNGEPWHVPNIILQHMKDKKYTAYYEVPVPGKRHKAKKTRQVPEFAIEVLPPLTSQEMKDLRQRQAMAASAVSDQ